MIHMNPAAIAICAVAALFSTSCIYDAPGDRFYRTLWESDEVPLGPFAIDALTLEFLCNGSVRLTLTDDDGTTNTYGTYEADDLNAVFNNLSITIQGRNITFIEAHRSSEAGSGSTLFLLWRIEDSVYPFTTAMHKLSSYE